MTAQAKKTSPKAPRVTPPSTKGPYPFRTAWFLFLLAINFLVAAYYFHIIE